LVLSMVKIRRFKNINNLELELDRVNVLIGSNNSGKSSILQAIQFAVSVAQTSSLETGARWLQKKDELATSISPMQLIYLPFRDVLALAPNRDLREDPESAIEISFGESDTSDEATIRVSKGRNKNIRIGIIGSNLGKKLQLIESPFSIFVTGLAGVPAVEEYKTSSIVRKAAAKGDSNNVFRNVLYLLKQDEYGWERFIQDLQEIFPKIGIYVNFNPDRDEYIEAIVDINDEKLPIDAAGTGVLQAIQILSYINLYKPRLLLLDEPDSHLHPNNQRKLINMLTKLADERDFQIILSTHSRHIFDELNGNAKMHWIRNGKVVKDSDFDEMNILMDIGALDKGDLLIHDKIKCVLLTEDQKYKPIEVILKASGFKLKDVDIWAYNGCTNINSAIILKDFIKKHAPNAEVLLHRDRDYLTEEEADDFKKQIENAGLICFLTSGTDTESHYLLPEHINHIYPELEIDKIKEILETCIKESQEKSIECFINSRSQIESKICRQKGKQPNNGRIAREAREHYSEDIFRYCHGKTVLKRLNGKLQKEIGRNTNLFKVTPYIKDEKLEQIAHEIWNGS